MTTKTPFFLRVLHPTVTAGPNPRISFYLDDGATVTPKRFLLGVFTAARTMAGWADLFDDLAMEIRKL